MSELRRFGVEDGSDITNLVSGLLQRASFEREPDLVLERTVYDSFDWRLYGERTVLERDRVVSGPRSRRPVPRPWLVWRSTDTGEVLGRVPVDEVPTFAWDLPDAPTTGRLADILEMRALRPLVTVRTERTALRLLDAEGKTEARVVIDEAELAGVGAHADRALGPTVEVFPVRGYPRAAERVTSLLAAQVVLRPVERDTLDQALELAGYSPGDYSSKLRLHLDPASSALHAVVAVLSTLLRTMERNEPGTRADTDSEFLHDYRVAVRRTRSVLGMAKGVVPAALLADLRAEFKWLGDITTPTRDFDVYLLTYPEFEASLPEAIRADLRPLRDFLASHQQSAHADLVRNLDSPRYAELLARYRAWLAAPDAPQEPADQATDDAPVAAAPAPVFAAARTWKAYRSLVRDGRRITDDTPPPEVHQLRKDAKKLRYALECFGSLFPPDEVAPLVKELKGVQDVLGDFQDAEVQKASLRAFGESMVTESGPRAASALLAMGYLIEQLDERERDARERFGDRFASFDAHPNRHRFRRLFGPSHQETDA